MVTFMKRPKAFSAFNAVVKKENPANFNSEKSAIKFISMQHNPMVSLSEVMTFFIETSGRSSTKPMTCNDLYALGLEDNPYNTSIIAGKISPSCCELWHLSFFKNYFE